MKEGCAHVDFEAGRLSSEQDPFYVMKTAPKPEIDMWFDPPEMDEDEKAKVLRAALDEAWAEAERGEGVILTSSAEVRDYIREIGRRATARVDEERRTGRLLSGAVI